MAYTCHLCADAESATILVTPLAGGDTMAIGADCMVTGLCGLLSVATQVDPEQLYDLIITLRQQAEAEALLDSPCAECGHLMRAHGSACLADDCTCQVAGPPTGATRPARKRASRAKPALVPDSGAAEV